MPYTRCPVCRRNVYQRSWEDEVMGATITVETDAECEQGHWSYNWSYGLSEELIGEHGVSWTYAETEEARVIREAEQATALKTARRHWRESLKAAKAAKP